MLTVRWFTSSTTSSGETRTTSYHAPRRTLQFTSPRTRAHCGASGIVAPQELVALTHTRRWPGGAPSTAAALQARDTASRKGLPQGAVKEGRERVYAALANTGYTFPLKRITVNLAPADIRKDGSAFDLPIALGILAATEQVSKERLSSVAVLGELGLEGAIRPVRGALPVALAARTAGIEALILPQENLAEAGVVAGLRVPGATTLAEIADFLDGRSELTVAAVDVARLFEDRARDDVEIGRASW